MKVLDMLRRFGRLRWKLAFSYMAASVIGVFAVELLLISCLGFVIFSPSFLIRYLVRDVNRKLPEAAAIMEGRTSALTQYLAGEFNVGKGGGVMIAVMMQDKNRSEAAILFPDGKVAGGIPGGKWEAGKDGFRHLDSIEKDRVRQALRGRELSAKTVLKRDRNVFCAAPIRGRNGIAGVLILKGRETFSPAKFAEGMMNVVGFTLLLIAAFAGLFGIFFGFIVSRGLMTRLSAAGAAAESWSKGDFTAVIKDRANDELGGLSRRLNEMADSLGKLMEVRRQLAASEERNRITSELHDTVKQQAFAAAMLAAAIRARHGLDGTSVGDELSEVESILKKTQSDLTNIIAELAPPDESWKSPEESFVDLAMKWEARLGIPVRLRIDNEVAPDPVAGRILYLAASEAITNAARHSGAKEIAITLSSEQGGFIKLTVSDNGRGCRTEFEEIPGHGLRIMRERVESLPGGEMEVRTAPGRGFEITVRVFSGGKKGDNHTDG